MCHQGVTTKPARSMCRAPLVQLARVVVVRVILVDVVLVCVIVMLVLIGHG